MLKIFLLFIFLSSSVIAQDIIFFEKPGIELEKGIIESDRSISTYKYLYDINNNNYKIEFTSSIRSKYNIFKYFEKNKVIREDQINENGIFLETTYHYYFNAIKSRFYNENERFQNKPGRIIKLYYDEKDRISKSEIYWPSENGYEIEEQTCYIYNYNGKKGVGIYLGLFNQKDVIDFSFNDSGLISNFRSDHFYNIKNIKNDFYQFTIDYYKTGNKLIKVLVNYTHDATVEEYKYEYDKDENIRKAIFYIDGAEKGYIKYK